MKGRKSDGLADVDDDNEGLYDDRLGRGGIRKMGGGQSRPKPFEDIEVQGKERGRSSELGISNKYHRRLQTSDIKDPSQVGGILDLTKDGLA